MKKLEEKQEKILSDIREDEVLRNYFFEKMAYTSNPFPWLDPLKSEGYFNPKNNSPSEKIPGEKGLIETPRWIILGYLENISKQNSKTPNKEITDTLLEIIDSILNYQARNYNTDYRMLKIIFNLPLNEITDKHVEFIRKVLESPIYNGIISAEIFETVLPKLINSKSKSKLLSLLDIILDYQKSKNNINDYDSIIEDYWLNKTLKKYKSAIADLCAIEAAEIAINKIESILKEDKTQFNIVWITTIEDHPQTRFPGRYECQLVYFIRDMLEKESNVNLVRENVSDLLKKDSSIFRRIAVHTIDKHYEIIKDIFWKHYENENPLDDINLKHELYELFKNNSEKIETHEILMILEWIENKNYKTFEEEDEKILQKGIAYRKKEWLSSILETNHPEVVNAYEKYNQINSNELKHPGFNVWVDELHAGDISPIKIDDFCNKSNDQIADILINFTEKKDNLFGPSKRGLSETFRKFVMENPTQFTNNLKPFLKVENIYIHALMWGLDDAWKVEKEDFTWNEIFDFILAMIKIDEFWNANHENIQDIRSIISQIAFLIEDGTKTDRHAFSFNLMPQAERILIILAERTESYIPDMHDIITSVLNSPRGNIFSAMVNYSLRCLRKSGKWIESIKHYFDEELKIHSIEFSVTIGKYLPYLYVLDKDWVSNNMDMILPKEDKYWEPAFMAYLYYSSTIYSDIYSLLKNHGDYKRAIKSNLSGRYHYLNQRLIQHICTLYLDGDENLEDKNSLICVLIKNKDPEQLTTLIRWFSSLKREKLDDSQKEKIIFIWNELLNTLSVNEENNRKLIAYLSEWIAFVDEIDAQKLKWIKLSIQFIESDYDITHTFIENLSSFVENSPAEVGELFTKLIESKSELPDYQNEDIEKIVSALYESGYKGYANKICNAYRINGQNFLRDIYERYNLTDN